MNMKNKKFRKKKLSKSQYSKIIIVLCIVSIWIYAIASFVVQCISGTEISSTLTTCFFTFFGVEVISLAGIKRMKTKNIKYDDLTTMQDNYDSVMENIENIDNNSDLE